MPVTTRSNGKSSTPSTPQKKTTMPSSPPQSIRRAEPKPSIYYLLAYAFILAAGSLFSQISPTAGPSTALAPGLASGLNTPDKPSAANYFAHKHNLVNIYFVKLGWFWTTLAYVILQTTSRPSTRSPAKKSHYIQSALRYALVTTSWILTTQWFFGPALIDRSFTITGGHCEARPYMLQKSKAIESTNLTAMTSSFACKAAGGRWRGGHDISGHVFMLVLSSAFLLLELYLSDRHSMHPSVSPRAAAAVAHDMTEEERKAVGGWESEGVARVRIYSRYLVWGVVGLDLWMLMMTAIWFHTWLEKVSGLLIASVTLWGTYWLPDYVPVWRAVVGGL